MSEGVEQKQEQIDKKEEQEKKESSGETYGEQREKTERLKAQTEAKEIFSDVKDTEGLSKEGFQDIYKEFHQETGDKKGTEALDTIQNVLFENGGMENDATNVVVSMEVLKVLSNKQSDLNSFVTNILENSPAKLLNFIRNEKIQKKAEDILKGKKEEEKLEGEEEKLEGEEEKLEGEEEKLEGEEEKLEGEEEKLEGEEKNLEQIRERALENINSRLEENPELEKMFNQKVQEVAEKSGMDAGDNSVKLSVFKLLHENNPDFAEKYGEMEGLVKKGIDSVDDNTLEKVNSAFFEVSTNALDKSPLSSDNESEISQEINEFSSNNEKISDFESTELSQDQLQKLLSMQKERTTELIEENIDQFRKVKDDKELSAEDVYDDMVSWIENPAANEKMGEIFKGITETLKQDFKENYSEKLNSKYKEMGAQAYTNEIFQMFYMAVGNEALEKNQNKDLYQIKEGGDIEMNFSYKGETPLELKVDKQGNILMSDYFGASGEGGDKEKGSYGKEMKQINNFFSFAGFDEITNCDFGMGDLLENADSFKQIDQNLNSMIENSISEKLNQNNQLGNREMMQSEVQREMEKQNTIHEFMENYRPPVFNMESYESGNQEISELENPDMFNFMKAIENTVNFQPGGLDTLSDAVNNEKFQKFMENTPSDTTTSKVLASMGIIEGGDSHEMDISEINVTGDTINVEKLRDFNKKLDRVFSQEEAEKTFPYVEGYKREYSGGEVQLVKKEEEKKEGMLEGLRKKVMGA